MSRAHVNSPETSAPNKNGNKHMSTATAQSPSITDHLRRLYFVRFLFAAAWAATFAGVGGSIDAASVTLLIVYPAFDVAAAVLDARETRNPLLYVNIAISTAAAIGLAFAASDDIPAVFRVWAAWAIVSGAVQLVVALRRRALGGQLPMILAGGISVLAGAAFFGMAGDASSMKTIAGYATLGGLFFLISAVRLLRQSRLEQISKVA
jgi:uncharacterized membrane protein HdeD (DUF308 family)